MRKQVHILTNIDQIKMMGVCRNCGNVKLKKRFHRLQCEVKNKEETHAYNFKKRTGISLKDLSYKKMGACEICGKIGRIVCDHNHKTRKFRGFLCQTCNILLGYSHDDIGILIKASQYLGNNL